MRKVVGVKFRTTGREYYFDPNGLSLKLKENVIVETSRGLEFGSIATIETEVADSSIVEPLKKIVRKATDADEKQNRNNIEKREEALRLCQEKVDKHLLDMKLTDVEYTFDNSKIIFYFTSDGRVDFRELVKDLAAIFKKRIELRQIGVRDEAKLLGGIGNCGKSLCCHTWLHDFDSVSIKMAKVQNLSLNPTKISGICGRLMCCLKFENDMYVEMRKGMPSVGEKIITEEGEAVVIEVNILEHKLKARLVVSKGTEEDKFQEKLSNEVMNLNRDDIKRIEKKKGGKPSKKEEALPEEIKKLIEK